MVINEVFMMLYNYVILVTKIMLSQNKLHVLSNIDEGMAISAMNDDFALIQGRLYGGVDTRKSSRRYINFVLHDNCRFIGVELLQNGETHLFINNHLYFNVMTIIIRMLNIYLFYIMLSMKQIHITLPSFVT